MRIFSVLLKAAQVLRYTTNAHNKLNIKGQAEEISYFKHFKHFKHNFFGTAHVGGTIWHRSVKEDNLAPGQFGTAV